MASSSDGRLLYVAEAYELLGEMDETQVSYSWPALFKFDYEYF